VIHKSLLSMAGPSGVAPEIGGGVIRLLLRERWVCLCLSDA
jgi:hypothetical protein